MLGIEKKQCTGCSACYSACPEKCISMLRDSEGFLYPQITGDCINCGKCERVCPALNHKETKPIFKQRSYCVLTKNKNVWKRSASGGAFSEICRAFGEENGLFVGAAWNGFEVRHVAVRGLKNIAPLCKSKYIASDINDCFGTVKEALINNEKVVFCGTPCQVAGLKSFLGKEYENLLLIDLICHGVGSPSVFLDCMAVTEGDFGAKISSYEFRAKRITYETPHLVKLSFEKGRNKYIVDDRYMQLFLNQNCLRESCGENCMYRNQNREGDLTIADCKGVQEIFPELVGSNFNYSTVVTNTEKGESVIERIKMSAMVKEHSLESVKKYNPLFYRQSDKPAVRKPFFEDYVKLGGEEAVLKHTVKSTVKKQNAKQIIIRSVLPIFPQKLKSKLIRIVKK